MPRQQLVFDLDVDGFTAQDIGHLKNANVVIMNQIGFEHAFGKADLNQINAWMREHGVKTVIRTLAADGAQAYDGNRVIEVKGYDVPVVDVTGAGDTFGGALLYALPRFPDLRAAMEFAIAAASRAVTVEGPQGGVATQEIVEQFRHDYAASRRSLPAPS
jgi:ribokinase